MPKHLSPAGTNGRGAASCTACPATTPSRWRLPSGSTPTSQRRWTERSWLAGRRPLRGLGCEGSRGGEAGKPRWAWPAWPDAVPPIWCRPSRLHAAHPRTNAFLHRPCTPLQHYHAGMTPKQRTAVQNAWRTGGVKVRPRPPPPAAPCRCPAEHVPARLPACLPSNVHVRRWSAQPAHRHIPASSRLHPLQVVVATIAFGMGVDKVGNAGLVSSRAVPERLQCSRVPPAPSPIHARAPRSPHCRVAILLTSQCPYTPHYTTPSHPTQPPHPTPLCSALAAGGRALRHPLHHVQVGGGVLPGGGARRCVYCTAACMWAVQGRAGGARRYTVVWRSSLHGRRRVG